MHVTTVAVTGESADEQFDRQAQPVTLGPTEGSNRSGCRRSGVGGRSPCCVDGPTVLQRLPAMCVVEDLPRGDRRSGHVEDERPRVCGHSHGDRVGTHHRCSTTPRMDKCLTGAQRDRHHAAPRACFDVRRQHAQVVGVGDGGHGDTGLGRATKDQIECPVRDHRPEPALPVDGEQVVSPRRRACR